MTRLRTALATGLLFAGLALACGPRSGSEAETELEVFAAASLRNVARDLAVAFESESGATLAFNFAGSNTLAAQVLAAPRGQVFVSADRAWVDYLVKHGVARGETRRHVFSNRLALVAGDASPLGALSDLADLADTRFSGLVLADPEVVPAGRYARAALEAAVSTDGTLWQRVAPRIVPVADVRAVLGLVTSAPDLVGLVYTTDAAATPRVKVLLEIDPQPQLPIEYWALAIKGAAPELGARFLDFLVGPAAQRIVERHGFVPIDR